MLHSLTSETVTDVIGLLFACIVPVAFLVAWWWYVRNRVSRAGVQSLLDYLDSCAALQMILLCALPVLSLLSGIWQLEQSLNAFVGHFMFALFAGLFLWVIGICWVLAPLLLELNRWVFLGNQRQSSVDRTLARRARKWLLRTQPLQRILFRVRGAAFPDVINWLDVSEGEYDVRTAT